LKDYGYAGIDDSSKVRHLLKGIKTTELDVCKTQMMAFPSLRDDLASTVELYSTFINQIKAENPQLNVSELSFARETGARTRLASEVPPSSSMFPTLQLMTASLRK
jgi:hypothetical protein